MRTLTFGDRTISYDTGLDMLENTGEVKEEIKVKTFFSFSGQHMSLPPDKLPHGERKVSVPYSEADSGVGSECSEDHEDVERKLIKPDMMAISQLLNFDEVQIIVLGVKLALSFRRRKMT